MRLTLKKFIFLFLLALIIKFGWLVFIHHNYGGYALIGNGVAQNGVDSYSYIESIDNFFSRGEYGMLWYKGFPNHLDAPASVVPTFEKAIRTPHYGIFYGFFSIFLEKKNALDAVAILQLLLEVLAIIYLSLLGYNLSKSRKVFYCVYLLATLSSWVTFYTFQIMTESFTCSFFIFSLYFLERYLITRKNKTLFISGIFLSYAIAMKPFLFPVLLIFMRGVFFKDKKAPLSLKPFRPVFLLVITFVLVIAPWIVRNMGIYNRFFVFTNTTFYPGYKTLTETNNLIRLWGGGMPTWGGDCTHQISGYFYTDMAENKDCNFTLPEYVFTTKYDSTFISNLRDEILYFRTHPTDSLDEAIVSKISFVENAFAAERKFANYITIPLRNLRVALLHSGSYYVIKRNFFALILKVFQSALYWIATLGGLIGLIFLVKSNYKMAFIFAGSVLSLVVVLCIYFKLVEWRYFIFIHPVVIVLAGYAVDRKKVDSRI